MVNKIITAFEFAIGILFMILAVFYVTPIWYVGTSIILFTCGGTLYFDVVLRILNEKGFIW